MILSGVIRHMDMEACMECTAWEVCTEWDITIACTDMDTIRGHTAVRFILLIPAKDKVIPEHTDQEWLDQVRVPAMEDIIPVS
jgi:hypothetical protein